MASRTYAEMLALTNPVVEPACREAIAALSLPEGSHGLDAGCGTGLQIPFLARAAGRAGCITGVDQNESFLAIARTYAAEWKVEATLRLQKGDVHHLPFVDDSFDWAWSSHCVGYRPDHSLAGLRELARVVRPGGTIALLFWSTQLLLPGYPELEAKLNGTPGGISPFTPGGDPEDHFLRTLHAFARVGLAERRARAMVVDFHSPLTEELRTALAVIYDMVWEGAAQDVAGGERALFRSITDPDSKDFLPDRDDYYGFIVYSLFSGRTEE